MQSVPLYFHFSKNYFVLLHIFIKNTNSGLLIQQYFSVTYNNDDAYDNPTVERYCSKRFPKSFTY